MELFLVQQVPKIKQRNQIKKENKLKFSISKENPYDQNHKINNFSLSIKKIMAFERMK